MIDAQPGLLRRVVITGLGVVAPNGIGIEAFWQSCVAGRSGIRHITRFDASQLPTQIAGEVKDFDAVQLGLTQEEALFLDRSAQFSIAAANLALRDAGYNVAHDEEKRNRIGVYMGSAMPIVEECDNLWERLLEPSVQPDDLFSDGIVPINQTLTHASAVSIASHHQLHGPCTVISTGCSAGTDAIGQAYWVIQEGRADCMLAGGSDASISNMSLGVFSVMGALSTRNDDPERASRPYDHKRDGFVIAEGAAVILLEERELAIARGVPIYAELIAFTTNSNAHHMTALPPDGDPLRQLLIQSLCEANISAEQLGYINSHGSSTLLNETAETAAYKGAFGERAYHIPISSTKSMIGHSQGAASAIETVVTALVLKHQCIPPTINQEVADPLCDLDYVPNHARSANVHVALTHSSGFGGVNSVLILAHPEWIGSYAN
jgi:beta-ketoacyl-acyl-carrier-protein synthase II